MAVQSGSPNLAQYRTRLAQVLTNIVDGDVVKAPRTSNANVPFWVIGRPGITARKETAFIYRWSITLDFFLARQTENGVETEALADLIDQDTVATLTYFQDRQRFISTTLTDNQAGYIAGSLTLTANANAGYTTRTGTLVGSSYALSLLHRVVYTPEYQ